jgi:hypothetical protein
MTLRGTLSVPPADLKPKTLQLRSAKLCRAPLGLLSGRRDSSEAVTALQFPSAAMIQVYRTLLT